MKGQMTTAQEIIAAWNALAPEEQQNFCRNCVREAIRQGRTLKPGYELDDAVQSTFTGVLERLADVDKLEANCKRMESQGRFDSLAALIMRAAKATMESISYHARKDEQATIRTLTDKDGQEVDALDTVAAPGNMEDAVIAKVTLADFIKSRDDIDQQIIRGIARHLTEREIAAEIGTISNVAVHKRIVKIRDSLREAAA